MRKRETGYAVAYPKSGDLAYTVHPADYDRLKAAWMNGEAFVEVRTYHGAALVIKLANIEVIGNLSPESLAAERGEAAADKAEDAIHGVE